MSPDLAEPDTCTADVQPLPKFAHYLFLRRLTPHGVCKELGISREHARRICLPESDPDHRKPNASLRQKIDSWTGGVVAAGDWDAPWDLLRADPTRRTQP